VDQPRPDESDLRQPILQKAVTGADSRPTSASPGNTNIVDAREGGLVDESWRLFAMVAVIIAATVVAFAAVAPSQRARP
jgi:hypothetical protein